MTTQQKRHPREALCAGCGAQSSESPWFTETVNGNRFRLCRPCNDRLLYESSREDWERVCDEVDRRATPSDHPHRTS